MQHAFGPESEDTLIASIVLAHILLRKGEYIEANAMAEKIVEVKVRTLGPTHPDTYQAKDILEAIRLTAGFPPP
jgi:hypothetical protein